MSGWLLLSKTAVSELGERLWEDYLAFARRDLSEYETGIRAVERWRSVKLTEFERRQLAAITRSAALFRTAIILPSRVFPIRPLCPDQR
jgi:hypothetical protein